jgi:hypothetical protein
MGVLFAFIQTATSGGIKFDPTFSVGSIINLVTILAGATATIALINYRLGRAEKMIEGALTKESAGTMLQASNAIHDKLQEEIDKMNDTLQRIDDRVRTMEIRGVR